MLSLTGRNKTNKVTVLSPDEIKIDTYDSTFSNFAKLCFLIYDGISSVLQNYLKTYILDVKGYNNWLRKPEIHLNLRRLRSRGIINSKQWNILYSNDKESIVFPPSDLSLLILILKYTGVVVKPEPNGWLRTPAISDQSDGAFLVRLQMVRKQMASVKTLDETTYQLILDLLVSIVTHFDNTQSKIQDIMNLQLLEKDKDTSINFFKVWHKNEEKIYNLEKRLEVSRENKHSEIPVLQTPIKMKETLRRSIQPRISHFVNVFTENQENNIENGPRLCNIKYGLREEETDVLRKFSHRLISEVRPGSIIDHMLKRKILNIEESSEIFSSINSSDQMSILLDILVMKTGTAFTEFLNALKSRYLDLYLDMYEEHQQLRQGLACKPEGVFYCLGILVKHYNKIYSQWNPICWYPEIKVDLRNFYCHLQILDSNGSQIQPSDFYMPKDEKGLSRVTLIEGDHGTGKSYVAHLITAKWANDSNISEEENIIKLLFHLDLKITAPTLKWMLADQIFNIDPKLMEQELWDIIDKNQEMCLFILDGYNDNLNEDLNNLISGVLFPNARIIILSNLESTDLLNGFYQDKFILTGFMPTESMTFVENYIRLTGKPSDKFKDFLQRISKGKIKMKRKNSYDSPDFKNRSLLIGDTPLEMIPTINITMSLDETGESTNRITSERSRSEEVPENSLINSEKINTKNKVTTSQTEKVLTDVELDLQNKLIPIGIYSSIPLYCSFFCALIDLKLSTGVATWTGLMDAFFSAMKTKLTEREQQSRMSVNRSLTVLTELAFESFKQSASTLLVKKYDKIISFGVLKEISTNNNNSVLKYVFTNNSMQNYLAAKHLETFSLEEVNNYFQNMILNKSTHPLVVFYCGLRRNDLENIALKTLFKKIIDFNLEILTRSSDNVDFIRSTSASVDIMKFQLSLDCVAAMNGKNDLALKVGQILPGKLSIRQMVPFLTLQGFTYIIDLNCSNIKELDITFNYITRQMSDGIHNLAYHINQNTSIKVVRLFWDQLELMSSFLSKICEKNQTISTIECHDESNHKYDNLTQNALFNLRNALRNMKFVEEFVFRDCVSSTLIHSIARNIPENIISLDLSGCSFTIIACKDLVDKINQIKCLKILKFEKVHIQSMAFNNFIRSFSYNKTVVELSLNSTKMDNVGFISLTETLKLNNRLEKLFLSDIMINDQNCSELAQVVKINNSLKELHVSENRMSFFGQNELLKNAKNVKIFGLTTHIIKPVVEEQEDDIFNF